MTSFLPISAILFLSATLTRAEPEKWVFAADGSRPAPIIAVENVCAWPNLKRLEDGTILAFHHNQPAHMTLRGDVECTASTDGGLTWARRGVPGPRNEDAWTRGNVAAGLRLDGQPILLVGGWNGSWQNGGKVIPPVVSISGDSGRTWTVYNDSIPRDWPPSALGSIHAPDGSLIPFGDIVRAQDGRLVAALYSHNKGGTHLYSSSDDGRHWEREGAPIDSEAVLHEPALIHLGGGHWLCAARCGGLALYASDDDARTWMLRNKNLTPPLCYPGHILTLADGRLLLTYGNRNAPKGVDARLSEDRGRTWSEPWRIVAYSGDGGYPSSVQREDGRIVTAYYAKHVETHPGYHLGIVIWDPATTTAAEIQKAR